VEQPSATATSTPVVDLPSQFIQRPEATTLPALVLHLPTGFATTPLVRGSQRTGGTPTTEFSGQSYALPPDYRHIIIVTMTRGRETADQQLSLNQDSAPTPMSNIRSETVYASHDSMTKQDMLAWEVDDHTVVWVYSIGVSPAVQQQIAARIEVGS
jgi:hypothetical protein